MTVATSGPPGQIKATRLERAMDIIIGSPSKYATQPQRQAALCVVRDRAQELYRRDPSLLSERQWSRLIRRLEARYGTTA